MIDSRKITKRFIEFVCDFVVDGYKNGNDCFMYELRDDKEAYVIADKGIEKRIQKKLFKRLGIQSQVQYEITCSEYVYPHGELRIKLIKNEFVNNFKLLDSVLPIIGGIKQ